MTSPAITRCAGHTFGVPCEALVPRGDFFCERCWEIWDARCQALRRERSERAATEAAS